MLLYRHATIELLSILSSISSASDPPFRAPRLSVSRGSYSRGDVIRANCSVDEAYPAPNISWILDDHTVFPVFIWTYYLHHTFYYELLTVAHQKKNCFSGTK